jgi:hypothetical protein
MRVVFSILALALVFTDAHAEHSTASLNTHPIGGQGADAAISFEIALDTEVALDHAPAGLDWRPGLRCW